MVDMICLAFVVGVLAGIGIGGILMWRLWKQHILSLVSRYYLHDKKDFHQNKAHDFDSWSTTQAYEKYLNGGR